MRHRLDYVLISCVPSRHCTGASRNAPCAPARAHRPGLVLALAHRQYPEGCPSCMNWPLGWVQPAAQKHAHHIPVRSPVQSRGPSGPGLFSKAPAAQDQRGIAALASAKSYVGFPGALPGPKGGNSAICHHLLKKDPLQANEGAPTIMHRLQLLVMATG